VCLSGYSLAKTQAEIKLETRYFFSILLSSYPKTGHQPPVIMQGATFLMLIQCLGRAPARLVETQKSPCLRKAFVA